MRLERNKTTKILIIIFAVALLIEVGYALLSSTLRINGNTKISRAGWDVHFENIKVASGSVTTDKPAAIVEGDNTTVNYEVTLAKPGDFYEFTVDAVNDGTIDAMISTITNTPQTPEQPKYLAYTVTYSDGTAIAQKQLLAQQKTETFKVRVEFKKDIEAADLPTTETTLTLEFSANYVQADSTAVAVRIPTCKRAITLHTETCTEGTRCDNGLNIPGDKITYGNLETSGNTLATGDAFDCDVNGDGAFDAATERFYYVSDLDTNEDYAVLVYYNNLYHGEPNNTETSPYINSYPPTPRVDGPNAAIEQLPRTEQWSKVSLTATKRKIKDEANTEYADFDYGRTAARLLTYQEVVAACGSGLQIPLDYNCKFLMENTNYTDSSLLSGYWLETVDSSRSEYAWLVDTGLHVSTQFTPTGGILGVRPAIEVPKSKIES